MGRNFTIRWDQTWRIDNKWLWVTMEIPKALNDELQSLVDDSTCPLDNFEEAWLALCGLGTGRSGAEVWDAIIEHRMAWTS